VNGLAGGAVFSCDYNGWADVPEEEREAIDAFEAAHHSTIVPPPVVIRLPAIPTVRQPSRKAA
jgi:hypothetical protein